MKKYMTKALPLMAALSALTVNAYASPLKEDEIQMIYWGAFLMGGVLIYLGCSKLFDKFIKNRKDK